MTPIDPRVILWKAEMGPDGEKRLVSKIVGSFHLVAKTENGGEALCYECG